jgi:phosphate transport system ATP-binding protein
MMMSSQDPTRSEKENTEMNTAVTPSSLAGIAQSHSRSIENSQLLGMGLEARGIHAWFGAKHVLSDITLDFAAGTVTSLIGPSGCGKSTFLRTLNRMHEFIPTAGNGRVSFARRKRYL